MYFQSDFGYPEGQDRLDALLSLEKKLGNDEVLKQAMGISKAIEEARRDVEQVLQQEPSK